MKQQQIKNVQRNVGPPGKNVAQHRALLIDGRSATSSWLS
jgi:hypothetical protein